MLFAWFLLKNRNMKRIREKNINTSETFNEVFSYNFDYFNSYKNIFLYDKLLGLNLFLVESYMDYGCAGGKELSLLKEKMKIETVIGVDISDYVIKKNKELFKDCTFFTVDDFFKVDFKIDTIVSTHTIEHVDDPIFLVEQLLKRANKCLLIIVPCEDSWKDCEQHLWRFDKKSFDVLKPTVVLKGLTNRASNTELIFIWKKDKKIKKTLLFIFPFIKIFRQSFVGFLKNILKFLNLI